MVLEWPGAINLRWNAIMMKKNRDCPDAGRPVGTASVSPAMPGLPRYAPAKGAELRPVHQQAPGGGSAAGGRLADLQIPARISTAGFTAKMPSNMEQVTELLLQAYQLEPYRTDLLISAANAQIYNGNVDKAIGLFEQALSTAPDDIDLLTYLTTWQTFKHNEAAAKGYQSKLATLNPGRAADLQRIFDTVDRVVATPLKEQGSAHPSRATGPSSPWVMPSIPTAPCTTSC